MRTLAIPSRRKDEALSRVRRETRDGTILIVTIWITLALTGVVLVLARAVRVETFCSANEAAALQAEAVEQGAIQYVLSRVDSLTGQMPTDTDAPCWAVPVGDGAFWVLRPDFEDDRNWAFGITDEASKINLNTAGQTMLSLLPNMTQELAAAIIDWRDADDTVTPGGAESEYYLLLPQPYQCKNAPLETVEELFLVRDMAEDILYGEDTNRNGVLDPNEDDADASDPPDNRNGRLDRGLAPLVTVYSQEPNTAADGAKRVNPNDENPQALLTLLTKHVSSTRAGEIVGLSRRARPFVSSLDFIVRAGLTAAEGEAVADYITTSAATTLRGMINVNTAPRDVLACLPGLDESDVSTLMSQRVQNADSPKSVAWVAQAIKPEKAAAIGHLITTRTYRFSADIVSLASNGRAFRRCFIVIDAQSSPPRVIYRRDLTHLGWPLDPEIQTAVLLGLSVNDLARTRKTIGQEAAK